MNTNLEAVLAILQRQKVLVEVPADHDPDLPVVIPFGATESWGGGQYNIAAIVAFKAGELVAARSRACVYIIWDNGVLKCLSGVLALEKNCPALISDTPLPTLSKVLRSGPKEWTVFMRQSPWEKPYARVKNWAQGDLNFDPKTPTYCPATTYQILRKWNQMEEADDCWKDRMDKCMVLQLEKQPEFNKAVNSFEKYCNSIGLKKGQKYDLAGPLASLRGCIDVAVMVFEKSYSG